MTDATAPETPHPELGTAPLSSAVNAGSHVYLVDGSGYIFRAYHALPPLTRSDGTPVNAVLGFCNMLARLLHVLGGDGGDNPSHLAVVFDAGRLTFRNELYPAYKAHRPEAPEDLRPQFPLIREATRAFGVHAVELVGFEADDVIATYATQVRQLGGRVTIVSSDKDLMQLVGDGVEMLDPVKNRRLGVVEVMEKFGVPPEKVVDVQALCGDSVDNVPGVPGIGIKTAAELILSYGDLDALLDRAGEIKQPKRRENLMANAELARISRDLVRLRHDAPVPEALDAFAVRLPDPAVLFPFLDLNEFRSLKTKAMGRLDGSAAPAPASAQPLPPGSAPATPVPAGATAPIDTSAYETVTDTARLAQWAADAQAQGFVAFDTETTSLDAMRADLVGISLALAPGRACYIPLGHRAPGGELGLDGATPAQIPLAEAVAILRPMLEDESVLKIAQNAKYDLIIMANVGVSVGPVDDTMLLSYAMAAGEHGHGMDELSELHLGHTPIKFADVCGTGRNQITFDQVPLDRATAYAAEDADVTLRLWQVLKPRLVATRATTVYETLERPLIPSIVAMERNGVLVDRTELARLSQDFAERMAVLETDIFKLAGRPFNLGSPKQLGEILFDELGLGGGKKGKTGAYATGADILESLAEQGHDLPRKVLDWRQLSKLKSTYTDALQSQIDPRTGRVHTSFSMAATSTGRLSSTDPNLQNIPVRTEDGRRIRRAFVAAPGHRLVSCDYSQIELRLLAHIAGVPALKQAFAEGLDIHAMTASEIFGVPVAGMDPMIRRQAKAINFGIVYGISAFGLANQLGIPQDEAGRYIRAYFERFPGIRTYMDRTKAEAREAGYVTTIFGRRCHLAGIKDSNPARRAFMERAAINAPIQGSAADLMRRAMIRTQPALDAAGLSARLLLSVHDELVLEVAEAEVEETRAVVTRVMEQAALPAINLDIPIVVESGVGQSWAEAH